MMRSSGEGRRKTFWRRGVAVAALVVLLAIVNLAVLGVLRTGGDESETALSRLEGARAFYASESGARVVLRKLRDNDALPAPGSVLSLGSASVRYISAPATNTPGDVVVEGSSGGAQRRNVITIDYTP